MHLPKVANLDKPGYLVSLPTFPEEAYGCLNCSFPACYERKPPKTKPLEQSSQDIVTPKTQPTVLLGPRQGIYHLLLVAIMFYRHGHYHLPYTHECDLSGSAALLRQVVCGAAISSDMYSKRFLFPPLTQSCIEYPY